MDIPSVLTFLFYVYLVVLALLCAYGLHRYALVFIYYRCRNRRPLPRSRFDELPRVTVQLPMFNEKYVAQRIIEQACRIDYPRDRLQIQVLDDSTDETRAIARDTVERMAALGHNVVYLHRQNRHGFKAGALEEGTASATGDFIAIFDSDFLPPQNILHETIHYFTDPNVGMVQSRWGHLNRDLSLLTHAQAILLDGHFIIEHTARNRTGRFMSFNGTAGIWRRSAIADAGGWHHDTLTEDLDLSYRAQLKGWKFVFVPELTSPAELPPEMNAFKAQQHRWTKGGAQTCVKLLPRVLFSREPLKVKLEAFFHLTSGGVYVLMVLLSLLIGPVIYLKLKYPPPATTFGTLFDIFLFIVGTGSALSFYITSQRQLNRSWIDSIRHVPALMAIGMGIAFNNAIAAIEGFLGRPSEFVRTPKYGDAAASVSHWRRRAGGFSIKGNWQVWAELAIGLYLLAFLVVCLADANWLPRISAAIPFLAMFVVGYLYVAFHTLHGRWLASRAAADSPALSDR